MQRLEATSTAELYTEIRKKAVNPDTIRQIYLIQKKFETACRRLLEGLMLDLKKYPVGSIKRLSVIKLFESDFAKQCQAAADAIKQFGIGCISIIHEKKPSKQKTFDDHFTSNTAIFFVINSIIDNQKAINQILANDNVFVYAGADVLLSLCEQNDLSLAKKTKRCDDLLQKGRNEFKQKRLELRVNPLSDVKHLLDNVFTKFNKKEELKENYLQEEYKQLSAFLEVEIKQHPLTKKQQKESDILTTLYYNIFKLDSCNIEKHLKISRMFDFVFKAKTAYDNYIKIHWDGDNKGSVYELLYNFAFTLYEVAIHFTVLNESNILNFFRCLHWPDNENDLIQVAQKYPSLMRFYYEFVDQREELNRSQTLQETLSDDLGLPGDIVKLISQYTISGYVSLFKVSPKPLLSSTSSSNRGVEEEPRPKALG
jgi:hypothetical protein